jgi:hypothetical protein
MLTTSYSIYTRLGIGCALVHNDSLAQLAAAGCWQSERARGFGAAAGLGRTPPLGPGVTGSESSHWAHGTARQHRHSRRQQQAQPSTQAHRPQRRTHRRAAAQQARNRAPI